jgi:hypothetical protein
MSGHRLLSRTAIAAAVAAVGLTAVGCGGGASSSSSADASYLAAVTRAAYTTDQVPGYGFDIDVTSKLGAESFSVSGSGAISERGAQGSLDMQVQGKTLTEIIDKPYIYIKSPSTDKTGLTKGKPWMRVDINVFSESFGGGSLTGGSADPTQTLSFLKSAGTVTRVGSEQVRGAPATRYHAVVAFTRYVATAEPSQRAAAKRYSELLKRASGSSTLPMDVWIDGQGRVSRMSFALSLCSPAGGRLQESLNMELYGYGQKQPVLNPPSSSQVTDVSAELKAQLAKGLAQLKCH